MNKHQHWENIYNNKEFNEVSWYQENPAISIEMIKNLNIHHDNKIIDVGGGQSFLAEHLFNNGYRNISVLDISGAAIEKAKARFGVNADAVIWSDIDILDFNPEIKYDLWHDRATFHFLTSEKEIRKYVGILKAAININGYVILGTFAPDGPDKCSGLAVKKYSEELFEETLGGSFQKIETNYTDHITPSESTQKFIFCSFRRISE